MASFQQTLKATFWKLSILVWKNSLLRKARCCCTVSEIILPSAILIQTFLTQAVMPAGGGGGSSSRPNTGNIVQPNNYGYNTSFKALMDFDKAVAYTPQTDFTDKIIAKMKTLSFNKIVLTRYNSEKEIEEHVKSQFSSTSPGYIHSAVIFSQGFSTLPPTPTPKDLKLAYKIRIASVAATGLSYGQDKTLPDTREIFPDMYGNLIRKSSIKQDAHKRYEDTGFLGLQILVERAITEEIAVRSGAHESYPSDLSLINFFYGSEFSLKGMALFLVCLSTPVYAGLGYLVLIPAVLVDAVGEKETGIKEFMRMMGLPNWMHLVAWMLNFVVTSVLSAGLITFLLCVPFRSGAMAENTSVLMIWILYFLYSMQTVALCLLLASIFERGMYPMTIAVIGSIITMFASISFHIGYYQEFSSGLKLLLCVFPNVASSLAMKIMLGLASKTRQVSISDLYVPMGSFPGDWVSVGLIFTIMLGTIALSLILSLYLESVLPSTYGVRRPWYYIFMIDTWISRSRPSPATTTGPDDSKNDGETLADENFEEEPMEAEVGMAIKRLRKVFGGGKVAVNDVSLNIFKGQIMVLLGHNGAGKTTLMSMLTGLTSPTSGTATINGHNIATDLTGARNSLGLCPQDNMLFKTLTVRQHMIFFAMLKGVSRSAVDAEMNYLLYRCQLMDKIDARSRFLSGGQKRKLNLCMSLVGGSKTVILDEPTSGMDPEARRSVWDLLTELRSDRTILLTTHHMEEADVLGDRIAIMSGGKLRCCGSPHFLKQRHGTGYILHVNLNEGAVKQNILKAVQQHVPAASFNEAQNPQEVAIALTSLEDTSLLSKLFADMEGKKEELQIQSFGLMFTTMDDIFVKVALEAEKEEEEPGHVISQPSSQVFVHRRRKSVASSESQNLLSQQQQPPEIVSSEAPTQSAKPSQAVSLKSMESKISTRSNEVHPEEERGNTAGPKKRSGICLCWQHFVATILKRIWYARRKPSVAIFQILLPVVMAIISIRSCNSFMESPTPQPPLTISLGSYSANTVLYKNTTRTEAFAAAYVDVVGDSATMLKGPDSVAESLKKIREKGKQSVQALYIVAADFSDAAATYAMFSNFPNHAAPLAVNLINNAWLRKLLPNSRVSIQLTNHPLQAGLLSVYNSLSKISTSQTWVFYPLKFVVIFVLGLLLSTAMFVSFPVEEKVTKMKHLQFMTGINPLIFWGASLLVDLLLMLIIALAVLACLPIFQVYDAYTAYHAAGVLLLIIMSFGFAAIAFAYLVSLVVSSTSKGYALIICTNLVYVLLVLMLLYGAQFEAHVDREMAKPVQSGIGVGPGGGGGGYGGGGGRPQPYKPISVGGSGGVHVYPYLGRLLPFYGLLYSCISFATLALYNNRCQGLSDSDRRILCRGSTTVSELALKACCVEPCRPKPKIAQECSSDPYSCFEPSPYLKWWFADVETTHFFCYDRPGILQEVVFQLILGLVYMLIVIVYDSGMHKIFSRRSGNAGAPMMMKSQKAEEVFEEEKRVHAMASQGPIEDAMVLQNVAKSYKQKVAVSGISFGVHRGECFGLLGTNGAGKTTTFNIIAGDVSPSSGSAMMSACVIGNTSYPACDLSGCGKQFLKCIGYCPQENAFIGAFTGKELLQLFSRLRGSVAVTDESKMWLQKFGLAASANVQSKNYSGGMKRRLCAAMAMIGEPPVVLLDEPTSGVDPVARRQFWGILQSVQKSGQTIILTSHSMDECEALCSRLGIMVNGELQCFGGTGHIKGKYAQGFIFAIKLKTSEDTPEVAELRRGALMHEVSTKFQPCQLVDEHQSMLHYHVFNMQLSWSERFDVAEGFKQSFPDIMEDYTVTEANLEDVFLSFAKLQVPEAPMNYKTGFCSCCS